MNKINEKINIWFPTSIYFIQNVLGDEKRKKIEKNILNINDKIPLEKNNWFTDVRNTQNTYNILNDKKFSFLRNAIEKHTTDFAKILGSNYNYKCISSWFNIYYENDYQEYHIHPDCVFSAVYYVTNPPLSGRTIFLNPSNNLISLKNKKNNALNYETCTYLPTQDSLLIFRSNLYHMVEKCKNKNHRITIATNLN